MAFQIFIFIALSGAAGFGFLWAWNMRGRKVLKYQEEIQELEEHLQSGEMAFRRLKSENEVRKESMEIMQKQMHHVEEQLFHLENQLKSVQQAHDKLQSEKLVLQERLQKDVREIEVIREVPVLVPSTLQKEEDIRKIQSPIRLIKAYKKMAGRR